MVELTFQIHVVESCQIKPDQAIDDRSCQFTPGHAANLVPIIQIYGRAFEEGCQSVCLNVHGLFPYIYVECPTDIRRQTDIEELLVIIGVQLDKQLGEGSIHKIKAQMARRFYGYDEAERIFFKVFFFHPFSTKKAADLFQSGKIMNRKFRVYEVHLPFELQFLIDHNLFGMGLVTVRDAALPKSKQSTCSSEYDVISKNIMNRFELNRITPPRTDANGLFSQVHLMPSILQLLESMGLDINQPIIDLNLRPSSLPLRNSRVQLSEISKMNESSLTGFEFSLPKANDPYEEMGSDCLYPVNSPLFGKPLDQEVISRIAESFQCGNDSQSSSVSPIKTPTKRSVDAILPDQKKVPRMHWDPLDCLNEMLAHAQNVPKLDESESRTGKIQLEHFQDRNTGKNSNILKFSILPPSILELKTWASENETFLWLNAQGPFYSCPEDKPERGHIVHGKSVEIPTSVTLPLPNNLNYSTYYDLHTILVSAIAPPSYSQIKNYAQIDKDHNRFQPTSELDCISPPGRFSQSLKSQLSENDNLVILSVEIFAKNREDILPNPLHDEVTCLIFSIYNKINGIKTSIISTQTIPALDCCINVQDEISLFSKFIDMIVYEYDPDILIGFEIQKSSWGYLQDRYQVLWEESLMDRLSRRIIDQTKVYSENKANFPSKLKQWEKRKTSSFQVYGRMVLNVWRIMRSEISLMSYSFENIAKNILHKCIPKYKPRALSRLFNNIKTRHLTILYFTLRAEGNIDMLIKTEVLTRSCEFARLFGVDMYSVITRGSQYKVESMMARLARLDNFLLLSPSREDVFKMRAAEQTPLIMEPAGMLYDDPVVVLDFQSLYPSIMIAYNLCFSTCIKRVDGGNEHKLGVTDLGDYSYDSLQDVYIAVNGAAFVKPERRQGILPKMQAELLNARLQIKQMLKSANIDRVERKILDARQAGLKYILNVSYGYTAASFSGRMPCVEVADAIVGSGRATMHRAIKTIEQHPRWQAKVVYGDTDSLFVLLKGRSREDAFEIGNQIASTITAQNPAPMALKFEKVYLPCCLMSKKRYVGFKYDSINQGDPVFDAKGIETVRRDSCPLVSQTLENTIRILFQTKDISKVKQYVTSQFSKIVKGARHNLANFIFARQVKFGTYAVDGAEELKEESDSNSDSNEEKKPDTLDTISAISTRLPPSAYIASIRAHRDPRDMAEYGERIPFVVVNTGPSNRLIDRVVQPELLYENPSIGINANYYITKQLIPVLGRVLNSVGIQPSTWWANLAKSQVTLEKASTSGIGKYFSIASCWFCGYKEGHLVTIEYKNFKFQICPGCRSRCFQLPKIVQAEICILQTKIDQLYKDADEKCWGSDPLDDVMKCWALECPVFWKSVALKRKELPRLSSCKLVLEYLDINPQFENI